MACCAPCCGSVMVAEPESSTENPAAAEVAAAAAAAAKLSPEEQQKLNTALYEAAGDGKLEEAKAAVNAGADVSSKHFESTTPLHPAAARGHLSVVKLLVLHKTDLDAQSVASGGDGGRTPLMYASMWGQIDVINELLRAGANKNIKANSGMAALDWTGKYRAENRDAIISALS